MEDQRNSPRSGLRLPAIEAGLLCLVLALAAYLRLAALDFAQFRMDDIVLLSIARDFSHQPEVLTRGMHSSFGLPNGPFQAYLLLPGILASSDPIGAIWTVALINVLGVALFWAFVRDHWGPKLALLAALLYAVNPWAVIFSRRLWGNDLVPVFTVLLVWSLCNLARNGRKRDSLLPLLWLAVVIQVYVVALVHLIVAVLGLGLGARRLRLPQSVGGVALFVALAAPYLLGSVAPSLDSLNGLLAPSGGPAEVDLTSIFFMLHVVSGDGYQAFANQAGGLLDASSGFPRAVSLVTEAFLVIGLGVACVEVIRGLGRRSTEQTARYILPLAAVVIPPLLLVRHTAPVYPYYMITGFPMHFLFIALGLSKTHAALRWRRSEWIGPLNSLRNYAVPAMATLILATHLLLAQVFLKSIGDYWPKSDYGFPLRYTLDIAETARELVKREGFSRVYVGGSNERDRVISLTLTSPVPSAWFDSKSTFIKPAPNAGKALYILSSTEDRVGQVLDNHLAEAEVASFDVPGAGLRYSFYGVEEADLGNLFSDARGTPMSVTFDGRVRLDGYLASTELRRGGQDQLTLRWTLLEEASPSLPEYKVYLRLMDLSQKAHFGEDFYFHDPTQWRFGEEIISWHTVAVPPNLEPGVYSYLVGLFTAGLSTPYRNASAVDGSGNPVGDGIRLGTLRVRPDATQAPSHKLSVGFGRSVALEGYDVVDLGCAPDRSLDVSLYWKALERTDRDYTAFVHLVGLNGEVVSQHDSQPVSARYPTTAWLPGDRIVDRHSLRLPPGLAPGQYNVAAGLYYLPTGERLGGPSNAGVFPLFLGGCGQ